MLKQLEYIDYKSLTMYIWEINMCFLFIVVIIFYADALSYKVTLIILVILLLLKQTFLCAFL